MKNKERENRPLKFVSSQIERECRFSVRRRQHANRADDEDVDDDDGAPENITCNHVIVSSPRLKRRKVCVGNKEVKFYVYTYNSTTNERMIFRI